MKEKHSTTFISEDGLEFKTKDECLLWERVADKVTRVENAVNCVDLDACEEDGIEIPPESIIKLLLYDWCGSGLLDSCLDVEWNYTKSDGKHYRSEAVCASVSPDKVRRLKEFTDWLFSE